MTIVYINSFNFGSTGNICLQLGEHMKKNGHKVFMCVPRSKSNLVKKVDNQIFIGNRFSRNIHEVLGYITGLQGFFSFFSTIVFLRKLDRIKPDIIHLHNLHNCYINIFLLFKYIKKKKIRTIWTLHDCLPFTGKCPHFIMTHCNKWKRGCNKCPQLKRYPKSFLDTTNLQWRMKKKLFSNIPSLFLVTPSYWLSRLVKKSYLNGYPVKVIHNGINKEIFRRTNRNYRSNISEKYVIVGVSMSWDYSKGLDVFEYLSSHLNEEYRIVLVGLDRKNYPNLPAAIKTISRTRNQDELADIYSSADVFINPTREDNFPTVNMEALSCGTPVITFATGGSIEAVDDKSGAIVPVDDMERLIWEIKRACVEHIYKVKDCEKRSEIFSNEIFCKSYSQLYHDVMELI